jgi:hypothetical protein
MGTHKSLSKRRGRLRRNAFGDLGGHVSGAELVEIDKALRPALELD